jgi:excisionase family DNA binding protein
MTTEEVAALLRVNRKAIYGAVARGELPGAHRVGRKLRFSRDAVLAWLVDREAIVEAR